MKSHHENCFICRVSLCLIPVSEIEKSALIKLEQELDRCPNNRNARMLLLKDVEENVLLSNLMGREHSVRKPTFKKLSASCRIKDIRFCSVFNEREKQLIWVNYFKRYLAFWWSFAVFLLPSPILMMHFGAVTFLILNYYNLLPNGYIGPELSNAISAVTMILDLFLGKWIFFPFNLIHAVCFCFLIFMTLWEDIPPGGRFKPKMVRVLLKKKI